MEKERKEEIEARLRILHGQLDESSSKFGDWTLSRAFEKMIVKLKDVPSEELAPKIIEWIAETIAKLKDNDVIENRIAIRNEIEDLEAEMENI